ncbi:hypothetical protein ACE3NQ_07710 [Paenibacillus terreus]|uniref:Uncharacterized protein n=1 Tax=Paenibacillus terreus TaxID=1387834 RepID=A0ABV5B525_9BACL
MGNDKYLRKTVSFKKDDKAEILLYKELEVLENGYFSEETKRFWAEKLDLKGGNENVRSNR